jgi:hypothetical protein
VILSLLDPRIWLVTAAVAAGGYLKGCSDGKNLIRAEVEAQRVEANAEARRLEQKRQSVADEAVGEAKRREAGIRSESALARRESASLRDAINAANRAREESASAAAKRASALGELLAESAEAHRELAEKCDRHVSDLRMLLDAWPR